jgi:hypothetical protein
MLSSGDGRIPVRRWCAAVAAVLMVAACTSEDPLDTSAPVPQEPPDGCAVSERAAPDPERPVVDVDFRLDDDRRTVTGTERVRFTPDLPVEELWFRLIPNAPQSRGNVLRVDAVRGDEVTGGGYVRAGAARRTPGGLYRVDLRGPVDAGGTVEVELDFTLDLTTRPTPAGFDRLGVSDEATWWASGLPLLAWEPGHGWARDPFVQVSGETTAQAVADTTIRVSAPDDLVVIMSGDQEEPRPDGDGRRLWESREPLARDIHVAAGRFETATAEAGTTAVSVGVTQDSDGDAATLARDTAKAIRLLESRLGPFPYPTLTVALVRDEDDGGEEYASSILLGSADLDLVVHEVAHMWFFGMVGNSQFRDPWLDEAFASFAETVTHSHDAEDLAGDLSVRGDVAGTMADFAGQDDYERRVYTKGSAALESARNAAGEKAFDDALRCYVETQAWTIARPEDLARAFADLPEALDVLTDAGALDPDDLRAAAD